jgi:hypothetical protein
MDVLCITLANLFILSFMQKHTFMHAFIHIYMHNTEVWSRERSRRRPMFGRRLRFHEANDRSRDAGVELAKASSWLCYSRGSVCMRQTISPVMTGVELATTSSWLHYSRGSVCMRQTTGPRNERSLTCEGKYLAPL